MNLTNKKGVDISYANGNIDLSKVKASGYDFVMIRCGFGSDIGSQDDAWFESNVQKAESLGMPWGVYLYSYATNSSEARSEVEHVKRLLKGKKPTMPIALDVEDTAWYQRHGCYNRSALSEIVRTFINGIKAAGFYPMIYTGYYEIRDYLTSDVVNSCDIWLAQWSSSPDYHGSNLGMWQYGGETNYLESNSISGVGVIDKDRCYRDYPSIIKNGGYNGWPKGSSDGSSDETDPDYGAKEMFSVNYHYLAESGYTNTGTQVKTVQRLLNSMDYRGADGSYLDVDGIFGANTDYAVKRFQKANGLTCDGIVGPATWKKLTGAE